jgi:acyl carrier protein
VRTCVVIVRGEHPGEKRLVAYVVPTNDQRPTTNEDTNHSAFVAELRAFLAARLPDYMVPSAFVLLDALPLSTSGKLDRRALPTPDQATSAREFVPPRTLAEELLAEIWAQVLGVKQVGIYDNFFELGGHSLLVAQLMFRLREQFQVELPLRTLFEQPTIAALALVIEEMLVQEIAELSEEEALGQIIGF